jgi:CRP/FNR family transcriptional regulator, cyclic AMP receptor protein
MVEATLLEGCELFAGLNGETLASIARASDARAFERGDLVFRQDDSADELYIVDSGRFAIATRSPDGRETMLALMERGDLFGEMSLFDGQRRSADARALDRSSLIAVPFGPVQDAFRHEPDHLWNVVALLAGRLRATDEALSDAMFLDVPGRTAKRLLELAGEADEFHLTLTQEELAQLVGASRERVNKAIAQFVRLGWIDQLDRRYRVIDRDQLTRRAR